MTDKEAIFSLRKPSISSGTHFSEGPFKGEQITHSSVEIYYWNENGINFIPKLCLLKRHKSRIYLLQGNPALILLRSFGYGFIHS